MSGKTGQSTEGQSLFSLPHPNPPNLHHSNPHPIRTLALFVVLRHLDKLDLTD